MRSFILVLLIFPNFLGSSLLAQSISLNKNTISYGSVRKNVVKIDTIKIVNNSNETLIVDSIFTNTTSYILHRTNGTVTSSDTLKIIVTFAPTVFGLFTDTITIKNNSMTPKVKIPLYGSSPQPTITSWRPFIDFGSIKVSQQSTVNFGIINRSVNVALVDSAHHLDSAFKITYTKTLPYSIDTYDMKLGGDSLGLTVVFKPDSEKTYYDTIYIYSETKVPLMKIPLTGIGKSLTNIETNDNVLPSEFSLSQNYPNPFNPSTTINYSIAVRSNVTISIYNVLGQKIATIVNEIKDAGNYTVRFNAESYANGLYLYEMKSKSFVSIKKMFLIK